MVKQINVISVPYLEGDISQKMFEHLALASQKVPKFLRPLFFLFRSRVFAIPLGFFVVQTKSIRKKLRIIFSNTVKQQFQDEDLVENNWNSLVLFDYKKLTKLNMPVHVFHGGKDILVTKENAIKLAQLLHGTLNIIPNSGHMPPVETPITLANAIRKYF